MNISDFGKKLVNITGKFSCFGAILLVAFQYWKVINLEGINPLVVPGLYVFIIANGIAATPYIYLEKKAKVSKSKICPDCNTPLEKITKYRCPNCGVLKFEKD